MVGVVRPRPVTRRELTRSALHGGCMRRNDSRFSLTARPAEGSMVAMTLRKLGLAVGIGVIGLGGCARDVWSYRAVPDINISRPNQIDTKGALVLKTEPANAPSAFAT